MLLASLFLSGAILVCLPGLLRGFGSRIDPVEWAWLCTAALVVGAVAVELALVSQAAPTVLRALGVTALADACERMVGAWVPGGPTVGWAAAGAALGMPALAALGVHRTRRSWSRVHIEVGLGRRRTFEGTEVAVLPTPRTVAFSVRHRGHDQIVISDGVLGQLSDAEVDAVLRHESAHLGLGHHRYLLAGAAIEYAFARLGPISASVGAMHAGLERWADEEASGASTERRRNLAGAIRGVADAQLDAAVAALRGRAPVADRLDALESPPPRAPWHLRLAAHVPVAMTTLTAAVALGIWLGRLPAVVSMARCPIT